MVAESDDAPTVETRGDYEPRVVRGILNTYPRHQLVSNFVDEIYLPRGVEGIAFRGRGPDDYLFMEQDSYYFLPGLHLTPNGPGLMYNFIFVDVAPVTEDLKVRNLITSDPVQISVDVDLTYQVSDLDLIARAFIGGRDPIATVRQLAASRANTHLSGRALADLRGEGFETDNLAYLTEREEGELKTRLGLEGLDGEAFYDELQSRGVAVEPDGFGARRVKYTAVELQEIGIELLGIRRKDLDIPDDLEAALAQRAVLAQRGLGLEAYYASLAAAGKSTRSKDAQRVVAAETLKDTKGRFIVVDPGILSAIGGSRKSD